MVRTLEEVQGSRLAVNIREVAFAGNELTVRLTVDGALSEVEGLGSRLYTAEEVGDLQASEAELVAEPLRRRVAELERDLAYWREQYSGREKARADMEIKLAESRDLVAFKDKIRADIDQDNVKLRGKVRELAAQIRSARELLTTGEVVQARRMDCSRTGTTMGYAIGAALRALEGPPSPPTDETSQA